MPAFRVGCGQASRAFAALFVVAVVDIARPGMAVAQNCGTEYTIREGETLAQIASRVYGNPTQWTVIFYANQDRLGSNASLLVPGLAINLPCIGGMSPPQALPQIATTPAQPPAAAGDSPIMISALVRRIEFLTADGYAPFTGRALEGGGMMTELITSAMSLIKQEARGRFDYGVSWVNDWAAHLNPLLLTRAFDVGFPWARPDCDGGADLDESSQFRCRRFFFSDPIYEVITSLFVRNTSRIAVLQTEAVSGMTLCLPASQPAYELDQGGRNWVKEGKVCLLYTSPSPRD